MVKNQHPRWLAPIAVVALIASCTTDPVVAFQACSDDACRLAHIDAAFEQDPTAVEAVVRATDDAIAAATWVEHLAASRPEQAREICDYLPPVSVGHQRCRRAYDRPHLFANAQPKKTESAPVGLIGPRSADLPRPQWGEPPWMDPFNASFDVAGGACWASHMGAHPAYSECLFRAAETHALGRQEGGVSKAYVLCAASQFAPMCFAHVLQFAAPPPPPADRPDPADVAKAVSVADELREVLAAEPAVASAHLDRYWAVWVYSAFRIADSVTGDLMPMLPAEAAPHVRAAAAMRFLARTGARTADFSQVVQGVHDRLRVRSGETQAADPKTPLVNLRKERWLDVRALERDLPAAFLMGPGRRALAEDELIDLQIAVLEAAAQRDPTLPAAFFLSVVGGKDHELVRWTGARLGAQLDSAAAIGLIDESALVSGRLPAAGAP
jgi:hypothetical protein